MNYYFDESGNWEEIKQEKNRLVIAGMFIKDKYLVKDLEQELKFFISENHLTYIHASEIKDNILKDKLHKIIYNYIKLDEVSVLAYLINPKILFSETMRDSDEIYIDKASDLIGEMCFGDKNLDIEYDMKFHYAYPQKIIENIKKGRQYDEYVKMSRNFSLTKDALEKQRDRIRDIICRNTNKIDNIDNVIQKLENAEFISQYLWEEFRLKTEKAAIIREKFKDRVYGYIKQQCKAFSIPFYDVKLKIQYENKYNQSAGVQVVDLISNLLWIYGKNPSRSLSYEVKNIFQNITIKEISNEQI